MSTTNTITLLATIAPVVLIVLGALLYFFFTRTRDVRIVVPEEVAPPVAAPVAVRPTIRRTPPAGARRRPRV